MSVLDQSKFELLASVETESRLEFIYAFAGGGNIK